MTYNVFGGTLNLAQSINLVYIVVISLAVDVLMHINSSVNRHVKEK